MGDEDSILCAPGLTCETVCLYFSTRNTATAMILFAAIISVVSVVHVVGKYMSTFVVLAKCRIYI